MPFHNLNPATLRPGNGWRTGLMLATFAVAVQSLFLLETADGLLFQYPLLDASSYFSQAVAILAGHGKLGAFWQPPGYPYFLAGLCRIFGTHVALIRGVQALVLAPAGALLIWRVGRRLLPPTWAFGAAAATCVTGPLLFYFSQLLAAAPASVLTTAVILLTMRAMEQPGTRRWLAVGGMNGLTMLFVATTAALVPVLAVFAWGFGQPDHNPATTNGQGRRSARTSWLHVAALTCGILLVVTPVTLRNHAACGRWILISANSGTNFYIGNSRDWENTLTALPELNWNRVQRLPFLVSNVRTAADADAVFQQMAWQEARADPAGFMRRLAHKALVFWHGREIPRILNIYGWREASLLLRATVWRAGINFPCGLLVPLALVGACALCRNRKGLLLASACVAFGLLVSLYFPCSRYRVQILPLVVVLAGAGGLALLTALRAHQRRLAIGLSALLCAAGFAANIPFVWPTDQINYDAHTRYMVGMEACVHHDFHTAEACLQQALHLNPKLADAQRGLGTLYTELGDFPRAETAYAAAIALRPDYDTARVFLAKLLTERGQYEPALRQLLLAEESNPLNAEAFYTHATLLLRMGRPNEAAAPLNRAAVFNPDYRAQYQSLEEALAHAGGRTKTNALSR